MFQELNDDLMAIVVELNKIIPQLKGFINNWHDTINYYNINVITDSSGQLSIDVPSDLDEDNVKSCTKKIKILDNLIRDRFDHTEKLITKGNEIETGLKKCSKDYASKLIENSKILKELQSSFKH